MEKQILDYTLVAIGLLIMVGYHIWLLYQVLNHPATTAIGSYAINRRLWVSTMMQDSPNNGVLAVQTLRNNIMASTLLATMAIMLSSLIALFMSNNSSNRNPGGFVYGDTSDETQSLKFFSILLCFLVAFVFNLQSIWYYSHASQVVSLRLENRQQGQSHHYVGRIVNLGGYFWILGLRTFYFSVPLFLWIFGPIPAFISCVVLVPIFYLLDFTFEFGGMSNASFKENHHMEDVENNDVVAN